MKSIKISGPLVAATACFFVVGIPYWRVPYAQLNLSDALLTPVLAVLVAAALVLCAMGAVSLWRATWVVGLSLAAVIIARVVADGVRDPTSHNLWPIELLIATVLGLACAACGATTGWALRKVWVRSTRGNRR